MFNPKAVDDLSVCPEQDPTAATIWHEVMHPLDTLSPTQMSVYMLVKEPHCTHLLYLCLTRSATPLMPAAKQILQQRKYLSASTGVRLSICALQSILPIRDTALMTAMQDRDLLGLQAGM